MESEAAILEWDVKAHSNLDDCLKNNKRIWVDADPDRVFGEKFAAVYISFTVNLVPACLLWIIAQERPFHWDIIGAFTGFIAVTTLGIALHRWLNIKRLRGTGVVWRKKVNTLIDAAKRLDQNERQELYAAMYTAGLDVRQAKLNAAIAYRKGFQDGFILGGDDYCHH
jgi:hypothetical protein